MATTTKKGSKRKKANPGRAVAKTSSAKQAQTIVQLRQELAESLRRNNATINELQRQLGEALEQQTATSEILQVIASSPTDIQPVLDKVAENAARLCNANDASIRLAEGNMLRLAAHHGPIPMFAAAELPIDRDSVVGRAIIECQLIHIEDLLSVVATEFPRTQTTTEREGNRTVLVVPLMREDVPIGTTSF